MFYCKPQTTLKQGDLFGALCCPILPTWFAHQQMESGFLSLERIKAHESESRRSWKALDSTQSCSFWMDLSIPLKHMRHQQWTLPRLLPSRAASCSSPSALFLCMNGCLFSSEQLTPSIWASLGPCFNQMTLAEDLIWGFPRLSPCIGCVCCCTAE